uniref:HNH endonuclease n=1 Tax=Duodenibacillus massiliensis TaxID=1852381 RepID=UPI003AF05534
NVREYVLFRDGHVCQACKGRSKDLILNVHHIESRKTGGDAPGNLITLRERHPELPVTNTYGYLTKHKRHQAPYLVHGFRLFDKVLCKGEVGFIFGRRSSGAFDVRRLDGTKISAGISYKNLSLLEKRKMFLTELRKEGRDSSHV